MNSNKSAASPIISVNQPSTPLSLRMVSQQTPRLPSEHTMNHPMLSSFIPTGKSLHNPVSTPIAKTLSPLTEINSEKISSNPLKSHVKAQEILENPAKLRVLRVNKEDCKAIYQMMIEFSNNF